VRQCEFVCMCVCVCMRECERERDKARELSLFECGLNSHTLTDASYHIRISRRRFYNKICSTGTHACTRAVSVLHTLCMYVCMYVCVCVCVCVYIYVCMHACMHACMYACMYAAHFIERHGHHTRACARARVGALTTARASWRAVALLPLNPKPQTLNLETLNPRS